MRRPALTEGITNATATSMLGLEADTLARIRRRFRQVSQRDEQGEIIWRADIIRRAVELKAEFSGQRQKLSTERLIELAIREVDG